MNVNHKFINELFIEFLLLMGVSTVYGQVDSSLGFFPLHTGDVRQYHSHAVIYCSGVTTSSYDIERVIGDTILPTGFRYKIVLDSSFWPNVQYLRVDTSTANVYKYEDYPSPHDWLFDSLRATAGSTFMGEYGTPTECVSTDTATIFGVTTVIKRFVAYIIPYRNYTLAYGFGRIQYINHDDDPCYPVYNDFYRDLVYAKIDTVQHGTLVNVGTIYEVPPTSFSLSQNYPNPFNPITTISFNLPSKSLVSLKVFDVLGREIATVVSEELPTGNYTREWKAVGIPSGVYFYRLQTGSFSATKKLILLR